MFNWNVLTTTGAVRKNPLTSNADKKNVEYLVSRWLTGARDRDGKREKRRKEENKRTNDLEPKNNLLRTDEEQHDRIDADSEAESD
jgi:hypothetical protein